MSRDKLVDVSDPYACYRANVVAKSKVAPVKFTKCLSFRRRHATTKPFSVIVRHAFCSTLPKDNAKLPPFSDFNLDLQSYTSIFYTKLQSRS